MNQELDRLNRRVISLQDKVIELLEKINRLTEENHNLKQPLILPHIPYQPFDIILNPCTTDYIDLKIQRK